VPEDDGYFRERIAARYDESSAEMFDPAVVDPAVGLLVELAGSGRALVNTIMNLTTQAAQVACFRNVAAHLEPGGRFVIEVGVPQLRRLPPGETFRAFHVSETGWGLDEFDVATQGLTSHHFRIVDGRVERFSVPFRYVWPSELDLMAELAGMSLRERWSGWNREPFTSESRKHVSVWEKGEQESS
jgi:hypothetical protein